MSSFKPFSQKKHKEFIKNNPPCAQRAFVTAEISIALRELGTFVGTFPSRGKLSFRDARGQLWEITIEKSDVKKAYGEL